VTTTHRHQSRRKLDVSSLVLLILSVVAGALSYYLITQGISALVMIPSIVAATVAVTHLTKYEAPRD